MRWNLEPVRRGGFDACDLAFVCNWVATYGACQYQGIRKLQTGSHLTGQTYQDSQLTTFYYASTPQPDLRLTTHDFLQWHILPH